MTNGHVDGGYDVVVIGGGAAGLSGALALARSCRSVLVVDAGDPRNAPARRVHNFLTRDGTPPAEIYAAGRAEVTRYGRFGLSYLITPDRELDTLAAIAAGL
jgi:thioredoxin reductase